MPISASTVIPAKFINKYEGVSPFVPVLASSGTLPYAYAISPSLPTGLTLDASTGSIAGTPTQRIDPTTYTVTVTDAIDETASSTFILETNVSYLNAIDLVTNSTLTIQTVESLPISDRLLGDVDITEITVITNDQSGDNIETDGEILLTLPVTQESFKGSLKNYYGSLSVDVGTHTIDQQTYTTPGSYTWTVPAGVTTVAIAAIGGGGIGAQNVSGGSGGSGADLGYANNISVTAGQQLSVTVGAGGATGADFGVTGGDSAVTLPGTNIPVVFAAGGVGGDSVYWSDPNPYFSNYDLTGVFTTQNIVDPQSRIVTYSVSSASLPTGFTLNSSTGEISYTSQSITNDVEHAPFTLSAAVSGQTITKQLVLKAIVVPPGYSQATAVNDLAAFDSANNPSGIYWFSPPGATSADYQLYYQKDLQNTGVGWVRVFSSPYASTATLNLLGQSLPITQFMVRRTTGDVWATAGWNDGTYRRFNTRNDTGDLTTTGTRIGFRVFFGYAGGHGIYNTGQGVCNWPSSVNAVGAGYDGATCGSFPDSLRWGSGNATNTYDNRSGTYEIWLRW